MEFSLLKLLKFWFLVYFQMVFTLKQIITDSYEDVVEVCNYHSNDSLIVIDLLDIGIEPVDKLLHFENKKLLNKVLKDLLGSSFKVREHITSLEKQGFIEKESFLLCYRAIKSKSVLLITDKSYYIPGDNFITLSLQDDFYKKGVLFYRGNSWITALKKIFYGYNKIIFVSSNKNKIKKFLEVFEKKGVSVLFTINRTKLKKREIIEFLKFS